MKDQLKYSRRNGDNVIERRAAPVRGSNMPVDLKRAVW